MSDSEEDIMAGEPPSIDPYAVLQVDRKATSDQIKTAYRKAALKNHPDKVPDERKEEANTAFQSIAFAYAILSDPAKRKRYDATGSTSESIVDGDGFDWSNFYRAQYADAVTADTVEKFAKEYKGSDEERDDVLSWYEQSKGDMDGVYEGVMLSNVLEDDARFRKVIDKAIKDGKIEAFDAYTKETKKSKNSRIRKAKSEAGEAEELARELGVHDKLFGDKSQSKPSQGRSKAAQSEDTLRALISKRQESRGASFIDKLAEKYGANPKVKASKKRSAKETIDDEPSEEAFQEAAARLKKAKKSR